MSAVVAFITCPKSEAKSLCEKILSARLAACINEIPQVISRYHWENKIQEDQESLLMVKTTLKAFESLKEKLPQWHSYEVPELISIPIQDGLPPYLNWLQEEVEKRPC